MDEKDIPQAIIENNIYGIDLDDRAIQLAQLGLYIKAKSRKRNIKNLDFNIVSSAFFLPEYEKVADIFETQDYIYQEQKNTISGIWEDLKYAYKFGSLIRLREHFDEKIITIKDKWQRKGALQTSLFEGHEISKIESLKKDFFIKLKDKNHFKNGWYSIRLLERLRRSL